MARDSPNIGKSVWELSLYELHRTPQDIITDNTEIAVNPRSLHSELMCPICLDMLKNTMTTKECLHRFCNDCIITALRSGNKECPTCRKKLISKRSLRFDPNFDMLISKIHPSRDEYEAHNERLLASIHKQQPLGMSLEESLRLQALSRSTQKTLKRINSDTGDTTDDTIGSKRGKSGNFESEAGDLDLEADGERSSGNSTPSDQPQQQKEVELVFKPLSPDSAGSHSSLTETRFIKTTINATVEHLVKYLSIRHKLQTSGDDKDNDRDAGDESLFTLYLQTGPGQFQPLAPSMTLQEIREKYFRGDRPLALHYAYKIQICSAQPAIPDRMPLNLP